VQTVHFVLFKNTGVFLLYVLTEGTLLKKCP